jgi:hypothetical protein
VLRTALLRIRAPTDFIDLYLHMMNGSTLHIITPFGTSVGFHPECGLPQGDSIAPMLWNVFYDILLCALAKHPAGYTINDRPCLADTSIYTNPALPATRVNYLAFADDLTLISASRDESRALLCRAQEFFTITSIRLNAAKCTVLTSAYEGATSDQHPDLDPITLYAFGRPAATVTDIRGPTAVFRFLGAYLSFSRTSKGAFKVALRAAEAVAKILDKKQITGKMAAYVVNAVLIPRIAHILAATTTCNTDMARLDRLWMTIVKHKSTLPIPTPNIAAWTILRLLKMSEVLDRTIIPNLLSLLSRQDLFGQIARACDTDLSRRNRLPHSLLNCPDHSLIAGSTKNILVYAASRIAQYGLAIRRIPERPKAIGDVLSPKLYRRYLHFEPEAFSTPFSSVFGPRALTNTAGTRYSRSLYRDISHFIRGLSLSDPPLLPTIAPVATAGPVHGYISTTTRQVGPRNTLRTSIVLAAGQQTIYEEAFALPGNASLVTGLFYALLYASGLVERTCELVVYSDCPPFLKQAESILSMPKDPSPSFWHRHESGAVAHEVFTRTRELPARHRFVLIGPKTICHQLTRARELDPTTTAPPRHPRILHIKNPPFLSLVPANGVQLPSHPDPRRLLKTIQAFFKRLCLTEYLPTDLAALDTHTKLLVIDNCVILKNGSFFETNYSLNRYSAHCVKKFFGLLPTMHRQYRWLSCYPDELCRRCHLAAETAEHVTACRAAMPSMTEAIQRTRSSLGGRHRTATANLTLTDTLFTRGCPSNDLLSAVTAVAGPKSLGPTLRRLAHAANQATYELVWKPRCADTIRWESDHGVRRYHKIHPQTTPTDRPVFTPFPGAPHHRLCEALKAGRYTIQDDLAHHVH